MAPLTLLACGCELLGPPPHDTGPRYITAVSSSRGASLASSSGSPLNSSSGAVVGAPSTSAGCLPGAFSCSGTVALRCEAGGVVPQADCRNTGEVCAPGLGCRTCLPGRGTCSGEVGTTCLNDGRGYATHTCDTSLGQACDPGSGLCLGGCDLSQEGRSYVGCDYFPTVTLNSWLSGEFHFAVAVSNTTTSTVRINVTGDSGTLDARDVAPNSVAVVNLPWHPDLQGTGTGARSILATRGAYHLRSTRPVTVYQFNPLEYRDAQDTYSYTNDASLLLPTHGWTSSYLVASRKSRGQASFYAVTAREDDTHVTLTPGPQSGAVNPGLLGVQPGGSGQFTLNGGDVLEIVADVGSESDLTGTRVDADKPIQVIGGHDCVTIPEDVCCCDHIEESMFPIETLDADYIVTAPRVPGMDTPKVQRVRVVATRADTALTYDPPLAGAPSYIAEAGGWVEVMDTAEDFVVSATHPVLVVQYMEGQSVGALTGDPSMASVVGVRQHRASYLFHAPTNYETNYVNVVARSGQAVRLDGMAIPGSVFHAIGSSGYVVARLLLSNDGSGNHLAASTGPIGISVYGYGQWTSYWYPGGGNLDDLLH